MENTNNCSCPHYEIRNAEIKFWITKNSRQLIIADMNPDHLLNCISFLQKKIDMIHKIQPEVNENSLCLYLKHEKIIQTMEQALKSKLS